MHAATRSQTLLIRFQKSTLQVEGYVTVELGGVVITTRHLDQNLQATATELQCCKLSCKVARHRQQHFTSSIAVNITAAAYMGGKCLDSRLSKDPAAQQHNTSLSSN